MLTSHLWCQVLGSPNKGVCSDLLRATLGSSTRELQVPASLARPSCSSQSPQASHALRSRVKPRRRKSREALTTSSQRLTAHAPFVGHCVSAKSTTFSGLRSLYMMPRPCRYSIPGSFPIQNDSRCIRCMHYSKISHGRQLAHYLHMKILTRINCLNPIVTYLNHIICLGISMPRAMEPVKNCDCSLVNALANMLIFQVGLPKCAKKS